MPALTKSDLNYEYSWTAVSGDDPNKTLEDADRLSRAEGYEVLYFVNSLKGTNGVDLPKKSRLIAEWLLHEKLPGNIQGRKKVTTWIIANFATLKSEYPF